MLRENRKKGTQGFKHQHSATPCQEAHGLRIAVTCSQRRFNQVYFFISEDAFVLFFGCMPYAFGPSFISGDWPHIASVTARVQVGW